MEAGSDPENVATTGDQSLDAWRGVAPAHLKSCTASFPALKQVSIHDYLEALEGHGYEDIVSIQLLSTGRCHITLSCQESIRKLSLEGFSVRGQQIVPAPLVNPHIQLHMHDIPVWISDPAVIAALSSYGTVVGTVRHGRLKLKSGKFAATGVRFATFMLTPGVAIPSYVSTTGSTRFRVHYEDQKPTCRICDSPAHLASACPVRKQRMPSAHTRRWETPSPDVLSELCKSNAEALVLKDSQLASTSSSASMSIATVIVNRLHSK